MPEPQTAEPAAPAQDAASSPAASAPPAPRPTAALHAALMQHESMAQRARERAISGEQKPACPEPDTAPCAAQPASCVCQEDTHGGCAAQDDSTL